MVSDAFSIYLWFPTPLLFLVYDPIFPQQDMRQSHSDPASFACLAAIAICYFTLLPFWSDGFQIPASSLLKGRLEDFQPAAASNPPLIL